MVSTRNMAATLAVDHNQATLLSSINILSLKEPNRATKNQRLPCPSKKITKPSSPSRNASTRSPKRRFRLSEAQIEQLSKAIPPEEAPETPSLTAKETSTCHTNDMSREKFPSVVIGEHETVGLSIIGRADKEIKIWEEVLAFHQREHPSLAPGVEQKLQEAKAKRALIDETLEENHRVG